MTAPRCVVAFFFAALVAAGCGGGSSAPTAPTAPVQATRVITVAGNLNLGQVTVGSSSSSTITITNSGTATLTVTGITASGGFPTDTILSWNGGTVLPGSTQVVTFTIRPTTAGSFAGVLTVNGDHTSGSNTITFSASVVAATPFTGNWAGNYFVDRCEGTGTLQDILCSAGSGSRPPGSFPVGTSLPMSLSLIQTGSTVSGTWALGSIRGVTNGVVAANGLLTLQGTATSGTLSASISYWNTRAIGNVMDGFASYNITIAGAPGVGILVTRLGTVTK